MKQYYEAHSINREIGACTARGFLVVLRFAQRKFVVEVPGAMAQNAEDAFQRAYASSREAKDMNDHRAQGGDRNFPQWNTQFFRFGDLLSHSVYRDTDENRTMLQVDGAAYAVELEHVNSWYELTDRNELLGITRPKARAA